MHRFLLPAIFISLTLGTQPAIAKGFDPGKVDWEKLSKIPMRDSFIKQFDENCAACHGEDLRGSTLGTPLVGVDLAHGNSVEEIAASIATGNPQAGMPAWSETMSEKQIWNMALYVAEQRQGTTILDKKNDIELVIPSEPFVTELHSFTLTTVVDGLDPMPFAIAPLPDGSMLLSERMRGLSLISPEGEKTLITGTPPVYDDSGVFLGQVQGLGWMLDVAIHPEYEDNGWVYIHHTDRCNDCNEMSRSGGQAVSMNRVIRGRIKDGEWVDEQVIWEADKETYTNTSDLAAAGRLSFDADNNVYFSVGMKGPLDFMGIQELDSPYGKIHRVADDGSIPADNPFVDTEGAMPSVWAYGLRSVQGLEYEPESGLHWTTEMGPRGGDELNQIIAGGNYGWPVYTKGVNYDGRPVNVAEKLGYELAEEDAVFPVVDWTPAIAASSFIFYQGDEFAGWNGQIIVGTLRATDLLRLKVVDGEVVETEVLIEDFARFRDIEQGPNGELYLLLENKANSQIVRVVPASD